MKTFKLTTSVRNVLALVLFTAALLAVPVYFAPEGYVVQAGCTRPGRATVTSDGIPVCDCSSTIDNQGNCTCIIPCPKDGSDGAVDSGGAS